MVLPNLFFALAKISEVVLDIFMFLILFRAIISWVNPDPYNPIVQFLFRTTEPILAPIRRRLPYMAIDISPIMVFLVIIFLKAFLVRTLYDWAVMLR